MPDGFKMYQCMDCGCVGVKNIAEQKDAPKDSKVSRCNSCGAWQFDALPCHTCLLLENMMRESDEQYTPSWIFEALNVEYLDVCAEGGVDWIPAKNHYSLKVMR
jgi:hypothetical protein